ncbi:dTDP-4-dehydrorhamnose 3,5-epimerase family protein [Aestuariivirga sp.]|uniref:dTDP-4-dehydrorhamnose 3,5-epimerase family protein n=1 Tax=Aestuariivirga sp. TaxID=2650926 RepID=UPI0025B8BD5E|nr:dTDP-4-dehydrorhamnose 3,5-epimerase family protein [Aestuariivirga sp.]MCA3556005.1 dTDP-4-dehydrorhamnose 3,5-epimerase family protein [Aestuariivirga sp.]
MRISAVSIPGLAVVTADAATDERGSFARFYCAETFAAAGLGFTPMQVNLSHNPARHTLRGMHYQDPPRAEAKLVHVTRGAIYDVALDLRPASATYRRWFGIRLDAASLTGLFIPEGFAHGYITLEPDSDVLYHMGRIFEPGFGKGVRWNDPAFGIDWPARPAVISERDANYPNVAG